MERKSFLWLIKRIIDDLQIVILKTYARTILHGRVDQCYILTLDRAVNQEMHLRKQVDVRHNITRCPGAIRVSSGQDAELRASGRQRALEPQ